MKTSVKTFTIGLLAATTFAGILAGTAFAQDKVRVAFVPQIQGIPYYVAMEEGAKKAAEAFGVVRAALDELVEATPEQIARHFARARATSVLPLLESLAALGHAQVTLTAG